MPQWNKLGEIFIVNNPNSELTNYASNPLPVHLRENIYRIFYSGRNSENRSSIGFADLDIENGRIISYPKEPVLKYGGENTFYSDGISLGNKIEIQNKSYILFMGWQRFKDKHWRGEIGKLELIGNDKLKICSENPIISIDKEDEISLSYPFITFHDNQYKMWYGSTIKWDSEGQEMIHVIKYATSKDSITWQKHGIAVPYELGIAQAFSRPSVIIDDFGFHIWYSYRGGNGMKYRIGYAFSSNGINWVRQHNHTGIDVSENGWDSQMICYPAVFDHNGKRYMLYNGNDYGKTGFGLAILE